MQVSGPLSLFDGTVTATDIILTVDTNSPRITASMTVASDTVLNGLMSLSYENNVFTLHLDGGGSLLDGHVVLRDFTITTTKTSAYLAGSCTGSLPDAGIDAPIAFNISKPAVKGAKPDVALSIGLPSLSFGTLASSFWPDASGVQLPDFVNNLAFPSIEVSTPSLLKSKCVHRVASCRFGHLGWAAAAGTYRTGCCPSPPLGRAWNRNTTSTIVL